MKVWLLAIVMALIGGSVASATEVTATQSDWSGGPGADGPVAHWNARFADADHVAWRATVGRLTLSSTAISSPVQSPFPGEASGAIKVYAADVDLDGDIDVLGAAYYGNELVLFVNDGDQHPSWERQVIDGSFSEALAVSVADVDGDGLPDILGGSGAGAEIAWWRNLGGSPPQWSRTTVDDQVPGAHDVTAADLDNDGDTDIIGASYENDEILWWRNDGGAPPGWERFVIESDFDYPTKVAVADIDRDGDLDLFGVAWHDRQIGWWRNDGGDPPSWTGLIIAEGFAGAHWVDAADVDGDGWTDVIGAAMDLGRIAWWRNPAGGASSWQTTIVTSTLPGAVSAVAGDLDGDGDLDIAGAGWNSSGRMAWFENLDGQGATWQQRTIDSVFDQSSSAHIADVDGNGALDVLGSSWDLHQLAWWRVGEFVPTGSLTSSILDTGGTTGWVGCERESDEPESTILAVEARTSDNPYDMGPWAPIAPGPGCPGLLDGARYLQYRAVLESSTEELSPMLEEISFTWQPRLAPVPRRATGRVSP